jgi:hypothetical protein
MQLATINAIFTAGFLDVGTQLALQAAPPAPVAFTLSAVFAVRLLLNMRRVQRLDRFEKRVKGGGNS